MTAFVDEAVVAALATRGLTCLEHLGSGVFGDAFLARRSHASDLRVVKRSKEACGLTPEMSEVANMRTLNSDHVVHVYQGWCDVLDGHFYLELEYCNGGDLEQYLTTHFPLSVDQLLSIATQILVGLDHIHVRHMIHRDLKLENIFLQFGGEAGPVVKIGDFGLSKHVVATEGVARTRLGTPLYVPPELLDGHAYTRRADLWALGVSLFQLITNRSPFDGCNIQEVTKKILAAPPHIDPTQVACPPQLCEITDALLVRNRRLRPSTRSILQAAEFATTLAAPVWLPMKLRHTVALFVCFPEDRVTVYDAPSRTADTAAVIHYGDQVRAARRVHRCAQGELWIHLVHPICGFCRLGCGEHRFFQSLQDPRRHAIPKGLSTVAKESPCLLQATDIAADFYVSQCSTS